MQNNNHVSYQYIIQICKIKNIENNVMTSDGVIVRGRVLAVLAIFGCTRKRKCKRSLNFCGLVSVSVSVHHSNEYTRTPKERERGIFYFT